MATPKRSIGSARLKPLASGLALSLAMMAGSGHAALDTYQPKLSPPTKGQLMLRDAIAIASGDTRNPGWLPSRMPEDRGSEVLVEAWRARLPAYVVPERDASRGGINRVVTNCNDDGAGSLRATIVDLAGEGDTIDLTQLACGTITLTTGEIVVVPNNLNIVGPGPAELAIDGNAASAVLVHTGSGTMTIQGVEIRNGFKYAETGAVAGGCLFSLGSISVGNSEINSCMTLSPASDARAAGGGIYAQGNVLLSNTLVSGNLAINKYETAFAPNNAPQGLEPRAYGGGISALGAVTVFNSLIVGNTANSASSSSYGGGIEAGGGLVSKYSQISNNDAGNGGGVGVRGTGNIIITRSTISGNEASIGAGAYLSADGVASSILVSNSTVSGNIASGKYAGLMVSGDDSEKTIQNTTITRNVSESVDIGAGLQVFGGAIIDMQSTIVSGNVVDTGSGPEPSDIGRTGNTGGFVLTGLLKNNLVGQSTVDLPPSTRFGLAKVSSLRNNGGTTDTHALRGNSLAIDHGANNAALETDQRNTGFARTIGAATDVGSYELDTSDVVFADDYDDEG